MNNKDKISSIRLNTYSKSFLIFGLLFSILFCSCSKSEVGDEDGNVEVEEETEISVEDIKAIDQDFLKVDKKTMPILAWYSLPPELTTVERYQEMADAGITHSLTPYPNLESLKEALGVAEKTGIKIVANCPELYSETKRTVEELKNEKALGGYYIVDEPHHSTFSHWKDVADMIQSYDDTHFCYINLLPNYAPAETLGGNYNIYIDDFVSMVPVEVISFDHYPVLSGSVINPGWYENLGIVSRKAKEVKKPFWAFAISIYLYQFEPPSRQNIRLQMYTNLAYGAQGLEYWPYWTAYEAITIGPIDKEGEPTELYSILKGMNENINALSNVFVDADVQNVYYQGDAIPPGIVEWNSEDLPKVFKEIEFWDSDVLISLLNKDKYRFLVMVNQNHYGKSRLTVQHDDRIALLKSNRQIAYRGAKKYDISIAPGDILVYGWIEN